MHVIKASNASDFLGLVPALLGFTPTRSIVATPSGDEQSSLMTHIHRGCVCARSDST